MNLCAACLHGDPPVYNNESLEVHHIVPLRENFEDRLDDSKCITLCRFHHELAESGQIGRDVLMAWVREAVERWENI